MSRINCFSILGTLVLFGCAHGHTEPTASLGDEAAIYSQIAMPNYPLAETLKYIEAKASYQKTMRAISEEVGHCADWALIRRFDFGTGTLRISYFCRSGEGGWRRTTIQAGNQRPATLKADSRIVLALKELKAANLVSAPETLVSDPDVVFVTMYLNEQTYRRAIWCPKCVALQGAMPLPATFLRAGLAIKELDTQ
jgi:hypothetical protein